MAEGPVALFHRIVDAMVDHYRPEVDKLEERLDELEKADLRERRIRRWCGRFSDEKRDVASLRRIVTPQRDVIARLARRDFVDISTEMSFRFRDVYDHLVRIADDATDLPGSDHRHPRRAPVQRQQPAQEVMKVLTVVATIFMPLTLLTGHLGHERAAAAFPGRRRRAVLVALRHHGRHRSCAMLALFRGKHWI